MLVARASHAPHEGTQRVKPGCAFPASSGTQKNVAADCSAGNLQTNRSVP
jgi:hypothetical protein